MAKKTVYIPDELLKELDGLPAEEKANLSRRFQEFIQQKVAELRGENKESSHEYARRLLPETTTLEAFRDWLAKLIEQEGGPSSAEGPIALALAVLVYEAISKEFPAFEEAVRKEWHQLDLEGMVRERLRGYTFEPGKRTRPRGSITWWDEPPKNIPEEVADELQRYMSTGNNPEVFRFDAADLSPEGERARQSIEALVKQSGNKKFDFTKDQLAELGEQLPGLRELFGGDKKTRPSPETISEIFQLMATMAEEEEKREH